MTTRIWDAVIGEGPLVATAIHDGHRVRPEVAGLLGLSEQERQREEDPYTAAWTSVSDTRIIGLHSRFEVDLNRPRHKAVYRKPEDAWGLRVWKQGIPDDVAARSVEGYDAFYREVHRIYTSVAERHDRFVVFDLHTYNHRRGGPGAEPAPAEGNPEVNVGTGSVNGDSWRRLIDRFMSDLRSFDFGGRHLDVRENVKFDGGNLSEWTHENFPNQACSLAIEFKKFFMDEWTGLLDQDEHRRILDALRATVPGLLEELGELKAQ